MRIIEALRGLVGFERDNIPPVDLAPSFDYGDPNWELKEAIRLCDWWMGWPGHPGIATPICWNGSGDADRYIEALAALETSQRPSSLSA